jgi:hypothetical protein
MTIASIPTAKLSEEMPLSLWLVLDSWVQEEFHSLSGV